MNDSDVHSGTTTVRLLVVLVEDMKSTSLQLYVTATDGTLDQGDFHTTAVSIPHAILECTTAKRLPQYPV
jgi:hypothetical protein